MKECKHEFKAQRITDSSTESREFKIPVERNLLTLVTTIAKASSAKYNNAVERALD
jgi:hypothetical protein